MKVKELIVEATKSKKFQSYKVGYNIVLEAGDDEDVVRKVYQHKARNACLTQIKIDEMKNE